MNRKWITVWLAVILMFSFALSASAEDVVVKSDMKVLVDGKSVSFQSSYLINNSLFVPYRAVAESIGAGVSWDPASRSVTVKKNSDVIVLSIGSRIAYVNGVQTTISVAPPQIINNSTYVPVRFLSESLGLKVTYKAETRTVLLQSGASYTMEISQFAFKPEVLSITAGSTVTFVNRDAIMHNAVARDGSFRTPLLGKNESYTVKFDKPGEYAIYCEPHESFMIGKIVVR
jgi:plastocyanin